MRFVFLVLMVCSFILTPAALADEPAEEDSPAAKAYRDAWWLETGSGELARALELYEVVLGLEGSDAVKAQALFRKGMVLGRLGKTEEAIRSFERLVKKYPGEKSLHAEVRRRMEAWASENLKDSFDDWYDRYQFSPEFQAKVVDLVLRLGSKTRKEGYAEEESELLTIGKAAVPALRRHLDTSNAQLRERVTAVLLQLGEVPPVDALLGTQLWWVRPKAWTTLLTLSEKDAAPIREQASKGGRATDWIIEQVTHGPQAALSLPFEASSDVFRKKIATSLLRALLERPGGAPTVEQLEHLIEKARASRDQVLDYVWARRILQYLVERGEASDELLLDVLRHGPLGTRGVVTSRIQQGLWRHPEAWRAMTRAAQDDPTLLAKDYAFQDAFFKAIGQAGSRDDLLPAARALARALPLNKNLHMGPGSGYPKEDHARGVERLVPVVLAKIEDEKVRAKAISAYGPTPKEAGPGGADAWRQLLAWARDLPSLETRRSAANKAGWTSTNADLDGALSLLPELDPPVVASFLSGLEGKWGSRVFEWTDARVRIVIREIGRILADDGARQALVLRGIAGTEPGATRVIDLMLEDADGLRFNPPIPASLWESERLHRHVRDALRARWEGWSPAQRAGALDHLGWLDGDPQPDDTYVAWIREQLRASHADGQAEAERRVRRLLLGLLPEVAIDDLQTVYDLTDPVQALEAGLHPRIRGTLELYAAVRAARLHPDHDARARFWSRWTSLAQHNPGGQADSRRVHRAVFRDLMGDPDGAVRIQGVQGLAHWRDLDDVPGFVALLDDDVPGVRQSAAAALAKVYDRGAIQALAEHLDDPDLNVRETIVKTLEAIKKAEEAKDYWKKFAEER